MKRLINRSLVVLALVVIVAWLLSYRYRTRFETPMVLRGGEFQVDQIRGKIRIGLNGLIFGTPETSFQVFKLTVPPEADEWMHLESFGYSRVSFATPWWRDNYDFEFPHALLVILLLLWPTTQGIRERRRDPTAAHCPDCHYDLRGTPGDQCPECGHDIHSTQPPAETHDA